MRQVFPFEPFYRLVQSIGEDFKSELRWEPRAVLLICCALEEYLVDLLQDAVLNALHAHRRDVQPKDLQLARRVRGERM